MALFIFLWSLLFVIPGIVAGYRYAMAPFIMAENPNIGAFEAIAMSKEMMRGHKGELFYLHLTFIGWKLLALFTFGIGNLFIAPYIATSEAAFYLNRVGRIYGGDANRENGGHYGNSEDERQYI